MQTLKTVATRLESVAWPVFSADLENPEQFRLAFGIAQITLLIVSATFLQICI